MNIAVYNIYLERGFQKYLRNLKPAKSLICGCNGFLRAELGRAKNSFQMGQMGYPILAQISIFEFQFSAYYF